MRNLKSASLKKKRNLRVKSRFEEYMQGMRTDSLNLFSGTLVTRKEKLKAFVGSTYSRKGKR